MAEIGRDQTTTKLDFRWISVAAFENFDDGLVVIKAISFAQFLLTALQWNTNPLSIWGGRASRWQFIGICESHRFFCPRFFPNLTNFSKPRKTDIYIILKWSRRVFRIESITLSNWLPCYLYCSLFIQNKIKISAILPLAYSLIHERLMLYNSSLTKSLCSNYSFSW